MSTRYNPRKRQLEVDDDEEDPDLTPTSRRRDQQSQLRSSRPSSSQNQSSSSGSTGLTRSRSGPTGSSSSAGSRLDRSTGGPVRKKRKPESTSDECHSDRDPNPAPDWGSVNAWPGSQVFTFGQTLVTFVGSLFPTFSSEEVSHCTPGKQIRQTGEDPRTGFRSRVESEELEREADEQDVGENSTDEGEGEEEIIDLTKSASSGSSGLESTFEFDSYTHSRDRPNGSSSSYRYQARDTQPDSSRKPYPHPIVHVGSPRRQGTPSKGSLRETLARKQFSSQHLQKPHSQSVTNGHPAPTPKSDNMASDIAKRLRALHNEPKHEKKEYHANGIKGADKWESIGTAGPVEIVPAPSRAKASRSGSGSDFRSGFGFGSTTDSHTQGISKGIRDNSPSPDVSGGHDPAETNQAWDSQRGAGVTQNLSWAPQSPSGMGSSRRQRPSSKTQVSRTMSNGMADPSRRNGKARALEEDAERGGQEAGNPDNGLSDSAKARMKQTKVSTGKIGRKQIDLGSIDPSVIRYAQEVQARGDQTLGDELKIDYQRVVREALSGVRTDKKPDGSFSAGVGLPKNDFLDRLARTAKATMEARKSRPVEQTELPLIADLKIRDARTDDEITKKLAVSKPSLPTLTKAELKAAEMALSNRHFTAHCLKEKVEHADIQRLRSGTWLNDQIINFYGAMIQKRADEDMILVDGVKTKRRDVHYFNSFFFTKMSEHGFAKSMLARWTRTFDIFKKDIVVFPINLGNIHWVCAAINFKDKRIELYDSYSTEPQSRVYEVLREYLDEESLDKKKKPFDFTGWVDHWDQNAPQQQNGVDCGVFTCQTLEHRGRGLGDEGQADGAIPWEFEQKHIKFIRLLMVHEIQRGCLEPRGSERSRTLE